MSVYIDPDGKFSAIQYRPDLPNCNAIAEFLGELEDPCFYGDEPHADETWWFDAGVEAECGDWLIRYASGLVEVVGDEFYTGGRP